MKLVEYAIHELIKSLAGGRVYALRAPQNVTAPFIVFQRVDSVRWRTINSPDGIAQAFIQIDAYAGEYYEAKALAAEVETLLDGYRGTVYYGTDSPRANVKIGGISLQSDSDLLDQTEEPILFRSLNTFLVTYNQED